MFKKGPKSSREFLLIALPILISISGGRGRGRSLRVEFSCIDSLPSPLSPPLIPIPIKRTKINLRGCRQRANAQALALALLQVLGLAIFALPPIDLHARNLGTCSSQALIAATLPMALHAHHSKCQPNLTKYIYQSIRKSRRTTTKCISMYQNHLPH